ncbi:helix-turn-helix domain-containing protein [Streptomyces sp. NPDC007088]|uniref:helix-turn-helix domain-containing protein n=1 Tax=Streptomyces sp. NPDC007088 TaxID=3364773 RepID=UPI00367F80C9
MGQTIRSRRLGSDLRQMRRGLNLTAEAVAEELGFSQSKMSRIEKGEVRVSRTDLKALLALYGVTDERQVAAYVETAKDARQQGWWIAYEDALPREYRDFIELEGAATGIRSFEGMVVPGLLQTPDYIRHITAASPAILPPGHADSLIKARQERQMILEAEEPPRFWGIVTEGALRQLVGGRDVMVEQLRHLKRMMERNNVTLQVLPFEAGAHAGSHSAYVIFDFPADASITCVANLTGTLFMDKPSEIAAFSGAFDNLRASALSPADSYARITAVMDELRQEQTDKRSSP